MMYCVQQQQLVEGLKTIEEKETVLFVWQVWGMVVGQGRVQQAKLVDDYVCLAQWQEV